MKDYDNFIFSKEMREHMAPTKDMDVRDAVRSERFLRHLCKYAGMSDQEFNKVLNTIPEKT